MGLAILKYIWFLLVLASGLIATLLGLLHYGIEINFAALGSISNQIFNENSILLDSAFVEAYGFYSGSGIFLVFLILFILSTRAAGNIDSEPDNTFDTNSEVSTQETISDTIAPVQELFSSTSEIHTDPGDSSEQTIETISFDQFSATHTAEIESYRSLEKDPGESSELKTYEEELEGNDEWGSTLQDLEEKYKS